MRMMAKRYEENKAIFIADRNFATFNNMEHLRETGHRFLIRVKDIHSGTSLLKSFKSLPKEGEFDEDVHITFTNRQTRFIKNNPHIYKIIMSNQRFDFLDKGNHFYDADYRVVRIKINGKDEEYESLITNLDRKLFPASKIKEIGTKSRIDIEKMLDKKVNLKLFVKTKENWRDSDYLLRNFGLSNEELNKDE